MRRFFVIMIVFFLSACGSGGGGNGSGNGGDSTSNGAGSNIPGTSNFSITYTNTTDASGQSIISGMDYMMQWFVENADGAVRGPYTSEGTGVVNLGAEGRAAANLTMKMDFYYATYMGAPVQALTYYTGNYVGLPSLTVNLRNTGATGEMEVNAPYAGWRPVTSDPFQWYISTVFPDDILGNDNLANIFVSYRTSDLQEPYSYYDFRTDLPWNSIGSQTFDVSSMKNYAIRNWSCADILSGSDLPYVIARRKGLFIYEIGRGVSTSSDGTSGIVGVPDLFPADNWYLASGSINPKIVKQFSLSSSSIQLVPLDLYIDPNSLSFNASSRTFSFSLLPVAGKAGTDRISFGVLHLSMGGSVAWDIYFPWSSVVNGTLTLPAFPEHATLPAFDFAKLDIYRLDSEGYQGMILYSLNHKGYPLASYAMDSAFRFLQ